MFKKNGMLPDDKFNETYKQIEDHKEEIKRKSRKVRECLETEGFCFPDVTTNGNGDQTKAQV